MMCHIAKWLPCVTLVDSIWIPATADKTAITSIAKEKIVICI